MINSIIISGNFLPSFGFDYNLIFSNNTIYCKNIDFTFSITFTMLFFSSNNTKFYDLIRQWSRKDKGSSCKIVK